ncbi:MAG TPA: heme-binding protein [Nocardioides sp.]|uniref:GlcG/HbpS family heme-binding protein n=1 Tax=Nocardioides sp. TaxID=35761 RepID=UPI002E30CF61|nr:heme-binding protein [Nocardioides sp.]HEX5088001.1 heme-binding protein [Nocardioides sp.]
MTLSLSQARAIIQGTLAAGSNLSLQPLTVVVLDAGGHLIAAEREDGASNKRFEVAYGKAHGAMSLGMGSRKLYERAQEQPFFAAALGSVIGPLVPVPGGVLVKAADGTVLGAVGVSGDTSEHDEEAALAGIDSAGLVAQAD